ncbi:hypothetical protein ACP275_03G055500 [Erythranthe tilingii]
MASQKMIFLVTFMLIGLAATAKSKCRVNDDCKSQPIFCPNAAKIGLDEGPICYEGTCICKSLIPQCGTDEYCKRVNLICTNGEPICYDGVCVCKKNNPAAPAPAPINTH